MKNYLLITVSVFSMSSFFISCTEQKPAPSASYRIEKNRIILTEGTPFFKHLEIKKVQAVKDAAGLKTVGQMIALANPSGNLSQEKISWAELDHDFTKSLGLNLKAQGASVGTAFGVTSIPMDYRGQVKVGESVEISRYGLKKTAMKGVISQINTAEENHPTFKVIFKLSNGQDWYPGTNCEIRYLLVVQPVEIPTTAILHEGLHEYVLRQVAPDQFEMVSVVVLDEVSDMAQVVGLKVDDSVIASGAILFKPELHNFIQDKKESQDVLQ